MKVNKKWICFIGIICLYVIYCFFIPRINVLSISNRKNPKERLYSRDAAALGFCISYTHSVNKGRVHDYYNFDEKSGDLVMEETHFVSYGAGIPEPEETEGAEFKVLENGYLIRNINRQVPELLMAVGIIANHTLSVSYKGGALIGEPLNEVPFTNYFAPQTSLIFERKKINLIEYWLHRYKEDLFLPIY